MSKMRKTIARARTFLALFFVLSFCSAGLAQTPSTTSAAASAAAAARSAADALVAKNAADQARQQAQAAVTMAKTWATWTNGEVITGQGFSAKQYAINSGVLFNTHFANGLLKPASLPIAGATTLGGVKATARPANQFVTGIDNTGALTFLQPTCSNISNAGAGCSETIRTDLLTIVTPNVVPALPQATNGRLILLIVNGQVLTNKGASPPFTASGTAITWSATNAGFSLEASDDVIAIYTHN